MADQDKQDDLCDSPLVVLTHERAVVLAGPDGVALALTVKAAEESAARLTQAADEIKRQHPDAR